MDAVQMRDLMEHYGRLKGGAETCKGNIRRIKSSTFDEYIEEKTHRNTLGESRLNCGKSANPTETLGCTDASSLNWSETFSFAANSAGWRSKRLCYGS